VLFVDHVVGRGIVFGMLSVIMQLLCWSKVADPVIAQRAEGSGSQEFSPYSSGLGRYSPS
jgi:hypothetical protein